MVCVIGDRGVMGKRYSAILKYLKVPFCGHDIGDTHGEKTSQILQSSHFIIATPTKVHDDSINLINAHRNNVQILCEKPIVRHKVDSIFANCERKQNKLFCVNQYQYLSASLFQIGGITHYDYYNHGKDGLEWDCFQIMALGKGDITLKEDSPVWDCWINGTKASISEMDGAYVEMIKDFLGEQKHMWPKDLIISTTNRILKMTGSSK